MEANVADRKIYIHTNSKQLIGALVARHTLQRNSRKPERFDVEIITAESFPALTRREGLPYLREGEPAIWRNDDLQSFAPLRFAVPELMGYTGRAVVIDPGVFALGDINELLDADMDGAAVLARRIEPDARRPLHFASSVMLLDCARLRHWQLERDFWTAGAEYYRQHLADEALMVFPGMVLDKPATIESMAAAPRWSDVTFHDRRSIRLSEKAVAIHYRATARRQGEPAPYRALITSVYVRRENAWLLVVHQQTP